MAIRRGRVGDGGGGRVFIGGFRLVGYLFFFVLRFF